jgi:hypothetical protein
VFTVANTGVEDGWTLVGLTIDLAPSRGGLLFDTAPGGPGFNAAQPFQALSDPQALIAPPDIADGATAMTLGFHGLAKGERFVFGIDMDDTLTQSAYGQTIVDGAEVEGAGVTGLIATPGGGTVTGRGRFDAQGRAVLNTGLCA